MASTLCRKERSINIFHNYFTAPCRWRPETSLTGWVQWAHWRSQTQIWIAVVTYYTDLYMKGVHIDLYMCIYIYMCVYRERERFIRRVYIYTYTCHFSLKTVTVKHIYSNPPRVLGWEGYVQSFTFLCYSSPESDRLSPASCTLGLFGFCPSISAFLRVWNVLWSWCKLTWQHSPTSDQDAFEDVLIW